MLELGPWYDYLIKALGCVISPYFPLQGQNTLTFRGRSRRNKEDVNEVLYEEDIEVLALSQLLIGLQHM